MMPEEHVPPDDIWPHLTIPQIEMLARLAAGLTERETADRLQLRASSVRGTIDSLRRLTGLPAWCGHGGLVEDIPRPVVARAAGVRFGG